MTQSPSRPSVADGGLRVIKGHGTGNDFVLVPDLDGRLDLSPELVRALCDRRTGIGADGVLRVVRSAAFDADPPSNADVAGAPRRTRAAAAAGRAGAPTFFMDYRNADGSPAEMCGNGLRVYLRYLIERGLVGPGPVAVGTRGGVRTAWTEPDGQITVDLGRAGRPGDAPAVSLPGWTSARPGTAVTMPNPHVVVAVDGAAELVGLDLAAAPRVTPGRPGGQNVEFVHVVAPGHLVMRVHERGVGETRSCGTGIAAAAVVAMGWPDATGGDSTRPWRVDVPGGTCLVHLTQDGSVRLTGPAVLVARIDVEPEWLAAAAVRTPAAH